MPTSSKMGFTKQHYIMKPTQSVINYTPDQKVGDGSMSSVPNNSTGASASSYGGKK